MDASSKGCIEVAKLLLEKGANPMKGERSQSHIWMHFRMLF